MEGPEMVESGNPWVLTFGEPPVPPGIRLFCLPYAGGSPHSFHTWAEALDPRIEVVAVALPGQGHRISEKPHEDWTALTADAFAALEPLLEQPHAFYGHSFGARLGYELARLAADRYPGATRRLFVGGCRSPQWPQDRPYMHEQPYDGFVASLRKLGGTPTVVLDHPALMRSLFPSLQAQIRLAELWEDVHGAPTTVPVTAMYGQEDPIDGEAAMRGWAAFGGPGSEVLAMAGGHFFLDADPASVLSVIDARLSGV
ncbi:thioesterase II family protein [Actinacidiphila reveromycinica]|uniref:thioesterase II family protein n=1 Tax=Actinacidiphila reveromycinica TaxID=659352 RepID=UPI0019235A05|nr:alpha/beta fold hydrolase [Streptomyces sp. SN-593]